MIRAILFGLIFIQLEASAQENSQNSPLENFCLHWSRSAKLDQTKVDNKSTKEYKWKTNFKVLKLYGRAIFAKRSLLQPKILDTLVKDDRSFRRKDMTIYSIGASDYNWGSKENFRDQKRTLEKNMKELQNVRGNIFKIIENTVEYEECTYALSKSDIDFLSYMELFNHVQSSSSLKQEIDNRKIYEYAEDTARKFSREALVLARIQTLGEHLKQQNNSIALLVLHASDDGKLYDTNFNYIPRSVLSNHSENIKTLIIYSCYSSAVAKRYRLEELAVKNGIRIIQPTSHSEVRWAIGENTPAPLVKFFTKKALKLAIYSNSSENDKDKASSLGKDCSVSFETESTLVDQALGVFFNQNYLGQIEPGTNIIAFDCKLIRDENIFTLEDMRLYKSDSVISDLGQWDIFLNNEYVGNIRHIYFDSNYSGSKIIF
jgi:hypothetical protein